MPIRPENKHRYPPNWKEISNRIRFERAKGVCEFCQIAEHGNPHPITGSIVVLTTAHLDPTPENCDDDNLAAMCQRCHLTFDAGIHRANNFATRHARKAVADLFPDELDAALEAVRTGNAEVRV